MKLILILTAISVMLIILLCVNYKEDFVIYKNRKFPLDIKKNYTHPPIKNSFTGQYIPVAPRRMWGWVGNVLGYCGETCLQSIGLYFGNYISQGVVNWACGGDIKNRTMLIGSTSKTAAESLNFNTKEYIQIFDIDGFRDLFDTTINQNGHPIVMGWFDWATSGTENQYDHIMSVIGYDRSSDTVYFLDNYLLEVSEGKLEHLFQDRESCNSDAELIPQPLIYCAPNQLEPKHKECASGSQDCQKSRHCSCNYVMVVAGNTDPNGELFPLSLITVLPDEPDYGLQDNVNQQPVVIPSVTVQISGLTPQQSYTLIRFDGPKASVSDQTQPYANPVPTKDFLNASKACKNCQTYTFTATDSSMTIEGNSITKNLWSDGSYFYRCVKS
jgi:hypothetical protein